MFHMVAGDHLGGGGEVGVHFVKKAVYPFVVKTSASF